LATFLALVGATFLFVLALALTAVFAFQAVCGVVSSGTPCGALVGD
jgi:hypothetical protein